MHDQPGQGKQGGQYQFPMHVLPFPSRHSVPKLSPAVLATLVRLVVSFLPTGILAVLLFRSRRLAWRRRILVMRPGLGLLMRYRVLLTRLALLFRWRDSLLGRTLGRNWFFHGARRRWHV